jgi:hypothetical protein
MVFQAGALTALWYPTDIYIKWLSKTIKTSVWIVDWSLDYTEQAEKIWIQIKSLWKAKHVESVSSLIM